MTTIENEADQSCLSLFTSNHVKHDPTWMARGSAFKIVCIACLIEGLEDKEVLSIRKKKILSELLELVSRDDNMVGVFLHNLGVCSHVCLILVNLLEMNNDEVSQMAIEGLVQLACKLENSIIVREMIENAEKKVFQLNNLRKSFSFITLIAKLLHMIGPIAEDLVVQKTKFLDYCISNLFSEEISRLPLIYLVLGICKNTNAKSKLSTENVTIIFRSCCAALTDAKSQVLSMNSLALLQSLANSEDVQVLRLLDNDKGGQEKRTLISKALKKVVLIEDECIQIGGIQCMTKFLNLDSKQSILSRSFLQCGLAEFVFEGLETNKDVVLASLFCCLTGFLNSTEFFKGSYSLYGIDSVISGTHKALKLQNPETILQALHVLFLIVTKQPRGVPLFSNETTYMRCLNAIEEGLKSMNYKVVQEAINVMESLLRVDQLPSRINVQRILSTLSIVVALLKKFTTNIVDDFNGIKPVTAQELLCSSLAVVKKAITFVNDYRDKSPSLEEVLLEDDSSNANPSNREKSISVVNEFLTKAIDEICIAAVMVNFEAITNPMIFEVFFSLLNSQLSSSHAQVFAKKMASASFIRVSIDVNGKFCKGGSDKPLTELLKTFQRKLMLSLCDPSEKEEASGTLESAVTPSSPEEFISLLAQSSMDPITSRISDEMLFKVQCFCLELLYYSHICQEDDILPEQILLRSLHTFVCLHSNLGLLPRLTLKHLVFLYARITVKLKAVLSPKDLNNLVDSQNILEGALLNLQAEKFLTVSSNNASFVSWVFNSNALQKAFGRMLLEKLLADDSDKEQCPVMFWDALKDNETALRPLLSLVFSDNTRVVRKALDIVEKALQEASQKDEPRYITEITAAELQKFFLRNQVSFLPEPVVQSMLRILLSLQVAAGPEVEIKFLCFVIDILTKPATNNIPYTTLEAINYLNVTLNVNIDSLQPRVAAALFSNRDFVSWLQKSMTSLTSRDLRKSKDELVRIFSACVLLVSNLALSQTRLGILYTPNLIVEKDAMIELLNDNHSCLRLASLVFWEAYFHSRRKTFVVFEKGSILEQDSGNEGTTITDIDLNIIFIYLQNCLMHESEAVNDYSMACMKEVYSFKDCKDICRGNRWNRVILESMLFTTANGKLNSNLVQLCTVMLKVNGLDKEIEDVLSEAVKTIKNQIPKTELRPDDVRVSKIFFSCIEFLHEVLIINAPGFSSDVDGLLTWCKNLQEVLRKTRKRRDIQFIDVDQVFFPKGNVMVQLEKNKKLLGEVIVQLERRLQIPMQL